MPDRFLVQTNVNDERSAMRNAIQAALARNPTYTPGTTNADKREFREKWEKFISDESQCYNQEISDDQHCKTILRISNNLKREFGRILIDGHLRFGTSQKAFNLYLKFLWQLGMRETPPHCPVDRIVLTKGGIDGAWTKLDSRRDYLRWITKLREKAASRSLSLAEWEYRIWLEAQ